jgi:GH18 family chitinase
MVQVLIFQMFEKVVDVSWRAKFVESSIKLILDLGMDGIDIDYEW